MTSHTFVPDAFGMSCDVNGCGLPERHPRHAGLPPVDAPEACVGRRHPQTSKDAAAAALPRTGTIKRAIYDLIAAAPHGMTDDELEQALTRSHQSVSAARNSLMNAGWIEPASRPDGFPLTRLTRSGNHAIAWTPTSAARAATQKATR